MCEGCAARELEIAELKKFLCDAEVEIAKQRGLNDGSIMMRTELIKQLEDKQQTIMGLIGVMSGADQPLS